MAKQEIVMLNNFSMENLANQSEVDEVVTFISNNHKLVIITMRAEVEQLVFVK